MSASSRDRIQSMIRRLEVVALIALASMVTTRNNASATTIDRVQTRGGHDLVVWLGLPTPSADGARALPDAARFRLDGNALDVKSAVAGVERAPRRRIGLVIDAGLLAGTSRDSTMNTIRDLGSRLEAEDRILVVVPGERPAAWETRVDGLGGLLRALPETSRDTPNRLDDAVFEAIRRIVKAGDDERACVLVWTRGVVDPSSRALSDGISLLNGIDRAIMIDAVRIGPDASALMIRRLEHLASATGGTLRSANGLRELDEVSRTTLTALDRRIRVELRSEDPLDTEARHVLRFDLGDSTAMVEREFTLAATRAPSRLDLRVLLVPATLVLALGIFLYRRLKPSPLCLVIVASGDDEGCWFEVFQLPVTLGYRNRNDIVFDDPSVSGNHATLEKDSGGIAIRDTVSENGTYVNGVRVSRQRLQDHDRIGLGERVEFVFEETS